MSVVANPADPVAIMHTVAEHFRVAVDDIAAKRRTRHLNVPRFVSMYLMNILTPMTLTEIGRTLGGRDHTTVLHGIKRAIGLCDSDASLREVVIGLGERLRHAAERAKGASGNASENPGGQP